ncbi:hypothetical protein DID88_008634 [Monilinia fructigena]|uniref:Uncharacterized protein n=1 Tax=Monilinia fructigena TaxID=38457 RepID=A0A395JB08_9HELO|nr:hypothetical protein DID88_008634 [Monilinia fructigena]
MCDYTQVEFRCGHVRYTVRAWCTNYETTHRRCPPNVVAVEFRWGESEIVVSRTFLQFRQSNHSNRHDDMIYLSPAED